MGEQVVWIMRGNNFGNSTIEIYDDDMSFHFLDPILMLEWIQDLWDDQDNLIIKGAFQFLEVTILTKTLEMITEIQATKLKN